MPGSLTQGEAITRLCKLRDEMKKTPEGRRALNQVIWENHDLHLAYNRAGYHRRTEAWKKLIWEDENDQ